MPLLKCVVCGSKKTRFIQRKWDSRLLSTIGLNITLSKIHLLGNTFFRDKK